MPASPIEPRSAEPAAVSFRIRGGNGGPERARRHLVSQLSLDVPRARASDAVLVVSELVTNSVLHANVTVDDVLLLELTPLGDRMRIAVTDPGSELEPRLLARESATSGGFGMRLVDRICLSWGVVREPTGATRVWCEVPLEHAVAR